MKTSEADVEDAEGVEVGKVVAGVTAGGTLAVSPTSQVCCGVKLGGEQGKLLRKPSKLKVKH